TNRGESLRLAAICQGGRRVSESTIARARASSVAPRESRGADTAATIAPVRVSASRIYNQVGAPGSGSRCVNQSRYAVGPPPPFTAVRTEYPRRFSPRPISRLSESLRVTRISYARTEPGARYPMAGAQEARTARHDGTTARCPRCHTPSAVLATCRRAVVYRLTELLASPPPSDPASTPPPGHGCRAGTASHRASSCG